VDLKRAKAKKKKALMANIQNSKPLATVERCRPPPPLAFQPKKMISNLYPNDFTKILEKNPFFSFLAANHRRNQPALADVKTSHFKKKKHTSSKSNYTIINNQLTLTPSSSKTTPTIS